MFSTPPNLADRFRSLLEGLMGALDRERRGWFGGPLALLMWIRTRRERKEAEAALEQVKAMLGQFVVLLQELQAASPVGPTTPEAEAAALVPEAPQSALPRRPGPAIAHLRCSAPSAVGSFNRGERGGAQSEGEIPASQPSPATVGAGVAVAAVGQAARPGLRRAASRLRTDAELWLAPRARPPPGGVVAGDNSGRWARMGGECARISLRFSQ